MSKKKQINYNQKDENVVKKKIKLERDPITPPLRSQQQQQSQQQSQQDIPGYYYDKEQNRYFKLTDEFKRKLKAQEKNRELEENQKRISEFKLSQQTISVNSSSSRNDLTDRIKGIDSINTLLIERELGLFGKLSSPYRCHRQCNQVITDTLIKYNFNIYKQFKNSEFINDHHNSNDSVNCISNIESMVDFDKTSGNCVTKGIVFSKKSNFGIYWLGVEDSKKSLVNSPISMSSYTYYTPQNQSVISSIRCCKMDSDLMAVGYLGSMSSPGSVDIYSLRSQEVRQISSIKIPKGSLWSTEWHPLSYSLCTGSFGYCSLWDLNIGKRIFNQFLSKSDIFSQEFNNRGTLLFNGSRDGGIRTLDLRLSPNDSKVESLQSPFDSNSLHRHQSSICCMRSLRNDDNYLLVSSMDGDLCQWDRRNNRKIVQYQGHSNQYSMLRFQVSPDERYLCSGGNDNMVRLWNVHSGELLNSVGPFENEIKSLQFIDNWFNLSDRQLDSFDCKYTTYLPSICFCTDNSISFFNYKGII
ncbi:hypothetical protein DLAC_06013 [Tieghemostelium lacteum]|uniref:Uncharacterized protein n=1 Tax=Tieghemostelium lacteum TaxID=361077 RepID=A0A151ZH96_TIELA|nr:hypothetical protein DLAC_06013 [Tieghemostelium lacteum]|eukprot:KYQ93343.1 hypothetical protein DLAC_06013 [Tieghemostelium lacteum]